MLLDMKIYLEIQNRFYQVISNDRSACADPENFLRGWGLGVQIPRRGLMENFHMANSYNLAIQGGFRTPYPPSGSAHSSVNPPMIKPSCLSVQDV